MAEITSYRPRGFQDVNIYMVLRQGDADRLITFLQQAFGATERWAARDPDGRLAHAEFQVGDSVVEIGESAGEWYSRVALHFFVTDVDQVHSSAMAAGGKEISPPTDHEYGERSSGVEDPCGNHWYIAKTIAAAPEWPHGEE